jgi:riboflavin synthase
MDAADGFLLYDTMFTGIITDIGEVVAVERLGDTRFNIASHYEPEGIAIGASIACAGCCLTVIETNGRGSFSVQASGETLSHTTLGRWEAGTRMNLERPLKMGDELGGHVVSGHVDGVGEIIAVEPEGDSRRIRLRVKDALARFIAPKGSVAIDGTSLTVNEVEGSVFGVNIIPHTLAVTTWGSIKAGDAVNVEIDMLARYVARLAEFSAA